MQKSAAGRLFDALFDRYTAETGKEPLDDWYAWEAWSAALTDGSDESERKLQQWRLSDLIREAASQ